MTLWWTTASYQIISLKYFILSHSSEYRKCRVLRFLYHRLDISKLLAYYVTLKAPYEISRDSTGLINWINEYEPIDDERKLCFTQWKSTKLLVLGTSWENNCSYCSHQVGKMWIFSYIYKRLKNNPLTCGRLSKVFYKTLIFHSKLPCSTWEALQRLNQERFSYWGTKEISCAGFFIAKTKTSSLRSSCAPRA